MKSVQAYNENGGKEAARMCVEVIQQQVTDQCVIYTEAFWCQSKVIHMNQLLIAKWFTVLKRMRPISPAQTSVNMYSGRSSSQL